MKSNNINSSYGVFYNPINKQKLVYYPCPKNANTSAKLFFARHLGVEKDYIFIGDKKPRYKQDNKDFSLKKNIISFLPSKQPFSKISENFIKCCTIRNPIKRFLSAYKNRILYHKDKDFENHSIDQILTKLDNGSFQNKHFLPQTFFLGNNLRYYDFYANVNNIKLFQIRVNEFFNKKINFPKVQTGGGDIKIDLTSEQISKIEKIYEKDFLFIEKSE